MQRILRGAGIIVAETPVPSGDVAAVAVNTWAGKLDGGGHPIVRWTGGELNRGQFHRADVNQPVLRARIAALVGGKGIASHAARANGGRAGASPCGYSRLLDFGNSPLGHPLNH